MPWAPITDEYPIPQPDDLDRVRIQRGLPDRYILYPAQTWPHKNHAGLLEALALLRRRGHPVSFVSTGYLNTHATVLQRQARRLGLAGDIKWLGFVDPPTLRTLYALATAVVVPTRFEAASGPVWEAFAAGVPVAVLQCDLAARAGRGRRANVRPRRHRGHGGRNPRSLDGRRASPEAGRAGQAQGDPVRLEPNGPDVPCALSAPRWPIAG